MNKHRYLESKSLSIIFFLFIFLLYAVVYMTKNMFSSAMAMIVEEGVMTKSQVGLINASYWFIYALFQVFGGVAADKYSPYKLIMLGLVGAVISNTVIYFNQSYIVMIVAWTFNAIAQFGVWPGVFKIVSTQIAPSIRGTAVFWLLLSTSVGLGLSLIIASFVGHWQQNFLVSVISLLIMIILYTFLNLFLEKRMVEEDVPYYEKGKTTKSNQAPMLPLMFSSGLVVFLVVCLLRGAIDNGIKLLTPVMLMESYETLPAVLATRMSSVLVIFSIIGTFAAGIVKSKVTRNEPKAQILFYSVCILPLVVVCMVGRIQYIWILVALSVATLMIQGAAPFSQSFITLRFDRYGRIGTVSGILNATASIGNVLASYVFAKMAEVMSWQGVTLSWLSVVIICCGLCVAVLPRWTKFTKR